MNRGITISITIPPKLLDDYDRQAKNINTSRSKVIVGILLNEFHVRKAGGGIEGGIPVKVKKSGKLVTPFTLNRDS